MTHRFGEPSYVLMNDFYQADLALRRFRNSPEWGALPEEEREATHTLLIRRMLDARDSVDGHPPWVLTPDVSADVATCRIVGAITEVVREAPDCSISDDCLRRIRGRAVEMIATEIRRVLFDRATADEHALAEREARREVTEKSGRDRARMIFRPSVYEATTGAARAKLGEMGDSPRGIDYLGQLARWQHFGVDVICRYEREKRLRGWLGWYYRWRERG